MISTGIPGYWILALVSRGLAGDGDFVVTDPMQSVGCPENVLQPILDRLSLDSLASPQFYREASRIHGLEEVRFEELTTHLVTHYARVLQETQAQERELIGSVTQLYIENMKNGLKYWIDGGNMGYLVWGIFLFRKAPDTSRSARLNDDIASIMKDSE
jgi:sarcosine/dimethylglycine N-methyltransferase